MVCFDWDAVASRGVRSCLGMGEAEVTLVFSALGPADRFAEVRPNAAFDCPADLTSARLSTDPRTGKASVTLA